MTRCRLAALLVLVSALGVVASTARAVETILLQSTTSTAHSGLYDFLLPKVERATGVRVHVVAVGTGQALANARNCDADALLVHAKEAEERFVAAGHGVARRDLMSNDFVIVGPRSDPVGLGGTSDAAAALRRIAEHGALFASRGDDSGTHRKERALWRRAGVDPSGASGGWYRETGSGMGATLNAAVGMSAHALTDRATWIDFANKADFAILVEGDPDLLNQYGVILVDPARCPNVKAAAAERVLDWLLSPAGQEAIGAYRRHGEQLFAPNATVGDYPSP